ncbi:hypothetical protein QYB59_001310 [Clostridium perfringens]|nr:hypothetical protein [Clostridium perfringens]
MKKISVLLIITLLFGLSIIGCGKPKLKLAEYNVTYNFTDPNNTSFSNNYDPSSWNNANTDSSNKHSINVKSIEKKEYTDNEGSELGGIIINTNSTFKEINVSYINFTPFNKDGEYINLTFPINDGVTEDGDARYYLSGLSLKELKEIEYIEIEFDGQKDSTHNLMYKIE